MLEGNEGSLEVWRYIIPYNKKQSVIYSLHNPQFRNGFSWAAPHIFIKDGL